MRERERGRGKKLGNDRKKVIIEGRLVFRVPNTGVAGPPPPLSLSAQRQGRKKRGATGRGHFIGQVGFCGTKGGGF